jgi:hypothetical protein
MAATDRSRGGRKDVKELTENMSFGNNKIMQYDS